MANEFVSWVIANLDERGWSYSELSRRMESISASTVSLVLSERQEPSFEFCIGVAKALGFSPDAVLRLAEKLPALPPPVAQEQEALSLFRRLGAQFRDALLATMRSLVDVGDPPSVEQGRGELRPPPTATERQAAILVEELQDLTPTERDEVFRFMKWVRDRDLSEIPDRGRGESGAPERALGER